MAQTLTFLYIVQYASAIVTHVFQVFVVLDLLYILFLARFRFPRESYYLLSHINYFFILLTTFELFYFLQIVMVSDANGPKAKSTNA
jgi:hypothetical protein